MATLIGDTSIAGGSNDFWAAGESCLYRVQCATSGTVDTLAMYTRASACTYKLGIYADSGSEPGSLLGLTANIAGPGADGIQSAALVSNVAVTSGTFYWLGFVDTHASSSLNVVVVGSQAHRTLGSLSDFPNPWTTASDSPGTGGFPIRGDGTAGGGGVTVRLLGSTGVGT